MKLKPALGSAMIIAGGMMLAIAGWLSMDTASGNGSFWKSGFGRVAEVEPPTIEFATPEALSKGSVGFNRFDVRIFNGTARPVSLVGTNAC